MADTEAPTVVSFASLNGDQPARRGRPPGSTNRKTDGSVSNWGAEDLAVVQGAIIGVVLAVTTMFAKKTATPSLSVTGAEASKFALPVTRIMARHIKVKAARHGDIADVLAIVSVMTEYTLRVRAAHIATKVDEQGGIPSAFTQGIEWPNNGN